MSVEEWEKSILLAYEREMLGLYVSDHPLLGIEHALVALIDMSLATLSDPDGRKDGSIVTIGGLVSSLTRKSTRATGEPYAMVVLEDLEGAVEIMVFPALYRQVAPLLAEDVVLIVKGRVREDEDGFTFLAMEISAPDLDVTTKRGPVVVTMPIQRCTPPVVERLKDVLRSHPGTTDVHLRLESRSGHTLMRLDQGLRVTPSSSLMGDIKALLGPGSVT